MPQTPLSSSTTLLSASEYLKRVDPRTIADLVSQDGDAVGRQEDGSIDLNVLAADAVLAAALVDASGDVEAAAMKGARYTPADLAAIVATQSAARGRLWRMVARLTTGLLYEQRPEGKTRPPAYVERALEQLQELRDGVMIFGTVETADAQTMEATTETSRDVEARNGITFQSRRFFGLRSNRIGPE